MHVMRLPKSKRIKLSGDFRRVREEGKTHRGKHLVLGVLRDESVPTIKVGFITTRRLGNAVTRNRVRRLLRAVVRDLGPEIAPGHFLVVIARRPAADASYEALRKEWKWLMHRAKLFLPQEQ